jgi:hypothetical protein
MSDETEPVRRQLVAEINTAPKSREELEKIYGQVWDTDQLRTDFDVHGFMAPFILVTRKRDNQKGTLMFQHNERYYFSFTEA